MLNITTKTIAALASVLALTIFVQTISADTVDVDKRASEFVVDVDAMGMSFGVFLDDFNSDIRVSHDGKVQSANFSFEVAQLKSNHRLRDMKMRKWINADMYPKINVEIREIRNRGSQTMGLGEITMHGVTQEVEIPFSVSSKGERYRLQGSAIIDHEDYDLDVIKLMFLKVHPKLAIRFDLVGSINDPHW